MITCMRVGMKQPMGSIIYSLRISKTPILPHILFQKLIQLAGKLNLSTENQCKYIITVILPLGITRL
jgi:hypothetical protein